MPDGSSVTAWIDGTKVAETQTTDSLYSLTVAGSYIGKTVTFKVGKYKAEQTALWKRGETTTLDLSINAWPYQCDFYGLVTVDGNRVPDGTEVSAWIDSARVQSTTTTNSLYRLVVPGNYTDKIVAFKVGIDYATQVVDWERGGELETNLTVSLGPQVCGFYGSVKLDGEDVPDGTQVSAWIDSAKVQFSTTTGSRYGLNIPGNYSGKTVSFQVNGQRAAQSTIWVRGDNKQLALTAITTQTPIVTLELSAPEIRPGKEFTITVMVDPKGHGISGGEIDLFAIDTSVMEILIDKVAPGNLLGTDAIEGTKEKVLSEEGDNLRYALARKGTTPVPTSANTLATITLRVKGDAKAGKYAIPNAISLADESFNNLDFAPPIVSISVIPGLPGDIDGDNSVGLKDLTILASAYGTKDGDEGYRNECDLNGDKEIGIADLSILAGGWGKGSEA